MLLQWDGLLAAFIRSRVSMLPAHLYSNPSCAILALLHRQVQRLNSHYFTLTLSNNVAILSFTAEVVSYLPSFSIGMVYFFAEATSVQVWNGGVLTFTNVYVNTFNAMNGENGIFTAPVAGHYQFIFSAVSVTYQSQVFLCICSGGSWQNVAAAWGQGLFSYTNAGIAYNHATMSANAIVYLNKGDLADIFLSGASSNWGYNGGVGAPISGVPTTQLTGGLIEEKLSF